MFDKDISEINIIYDIKQENIIRIFGTKFVENNKNICKMMIDNKEFEITEEYNIENYKNNNNKLKIILKGITNVTNMTEMFRECSLLSSLPDISKWNTNKVTNMSYMFYGCSSLSNLPDISKWNINKVTNMSYMFYRCCSLSKLPDISKWNMNITTNKEGMFNGCSNSLKIPNKFK